MPRHIRNLAILLGLMTTAVLSPLSASSSANSQNPQNTVVVERRVPLQSKTCVRENAHGDCKEWDYKYSVAGASCTAECVSFGSFDKCRLRNSCEFDERSGCFRKRTCIDVGDFGTCKEWEDGVACD
jgi:hypothetical protein